MNRPVGWGFLGAGRIAGTLAHAVAAAGSARLVAVGAREVARASALTPDRAYGGYEAVLADPAVDVVYVGLANDAHLPWARAALQAEKHVLCEKPLALDDAEVAVLQREAGAAGRVLVEASFYQWHPRTLRTRELLAAGAIGVVEHVEGGFTYRGVPAGNYRLDVARGGGAGYDLGCYPVSATLWAAGQVAAVAARSNLAPGGVDLTTELLLDLASGGTASLRCSFEQERRQWLRITGSSGEIAWGTEVFTAGGTECALELSQGRETERTAFRPCNPYALMVEAMSGAARGEPAWLVPLEQSRECAEVLRLARTSAAQGGLALELS